MTYSLVHPAKSQQVPSLARAKVVLPLMFRQLGTQYLFDHINVLDDQGRVVGTYDRFGWHDPLEATLRKFFDNDGGLDDGL